MMSGCLYDFKIDQEVQVKFVFFKEDHHYGEIIRSYRQDLVIGYE